MTSDSGETVSIWMRVKPPDFPPLSASVRTEVCVIGAGIAGMTSAYLLARAGKSVVVLDDGPIGGGESSRTTGHLSNQIDNLYTTIEQIHGAKGARLAYASHTAAIEMIASIVQAEQIACNFERVDGYLFLPPGGDPALLERERAAAERAGFGHLEQLARLPLTGFDSGPALRFPNQGQFHVLKYLSALAHAIVRDGGQIYCGTRASDQIENGPPARVDTDQGHSVTADHVVVATNTPINDRWADLFAIHMRQAAYRTYVIGARVPKGAIPKALYCDTETPYHYVRLQNLEDNAHELLIVGGEDHKTGQADDAEARYARLEAWARMRFPAMQRVEMHWSGQIQEPADGLALMGANPGDASHIYIITGESGQGLTHGTIGGMIITDAIFGRPNPWAALYDPARRMAKGPAVRELIKENLNTVVQYGGILTGGDVDNIEEIKPGEGAVIGNNLSKVAVYRDEQGVVHQHSAICTHLGCVVAWNSSEKSWDCPCHGSRFDAYGRVIEGPANEDLAGVEPESA
jgi:glycine/D-amino acid oxidase-like deaminating enzyme/nitrite reductase/ring-hydroxylating ferredoxin subunit